MQGQEGLLKATFDRIRIAQWRIHYIVITSSKVGVEIVGNDSSQLQLLLAHFIHGAIKMH